MAIALVHRDPNRCCAFCGAAFVRRSHRGRPPLYCRPNCRRRAHEHRRGVNPPIRPRQPPPVRDFHPEGLSLNDYDGGYCPGTPGVPGLDATQHALRPGGYPDHFRLRPTVCGALARPSRMAFLFRAPTACKSCLKITSYHRRPPPLGRGADLALIEASINRAESVHAAITADLARPAPAHQRHAPTLRQALHDLVTALRPPPPEAAAA